MARIKAIRFDRIDDNKGCTCDRCGQYIKNIWTVTFTDGERFHYGIDCFEKVQKSGKLNANGKKIMKRILTSTENHFDRLNKYLSGELNEETDESWKTNQADWNKESYWYGKQFNEYRKWMVEEVLPERIEEAQKELQRFSKINFEK